MIRGLLLSLWLLVWIATAGAEEVPALPGFNVHRVISRETGTLWRGGAPRRDTLLALVESAKARKVKLMLLDLRHPAWRDDLSGKGQRLTPDGEKRMAAELGLRYQSMSALDPDLPAFMAEALRHGDVYIHCMYGVNRTGFAVGRFATADRFQPARDGLGERDWNQGVRFQERMEK